MALDSLIREHDQLETRVVGQDEAQLISEFLHIEDRIYSSMEHLKGLGKQQLKTTPLYYQEAQTAYLNTEPTACPGVWSAKLISWLRP